MYGWSIYYKLQRTGYDDDISSDRQAATEEDGKVVKKVQKTYNSGKSLVVTHLTTNPPVHCLPMAERISIGSGISGHACAQHFDTRN